jgi:hypothetical protein
MYATIFFNILVVVGAILLLVFSLQTVAWFETCQYRYHVRTSRVLSTKDCTDKDKSMGTSMYLTVLVMAILVIPITLAMLVLLAFSHSALIEDLCEGNCFRKMVYNAKGPDASVSLAFVSLPYSRLTS